MTTKFRMPVHVKNKSAGRRESQETRQWGDAYSRYEDLRAERELEEMGQELQQRRWDAAETNRLNRSHYANVTGSSINEDIIRSLETLTARCRHEYYTNPMVEGVANTYAIDVVGERGPTLIVESDDDDYDQTCKQIWSNWFQNCEVTGIAGPDLLRRLIIQDAHTGDWLQRLVDMSRELPTDEPVKTRLLDIDPNRLGTPPQLLGNPRVVAGVQRDAKGRPTQYFVRSTQDQFLSPWFDWQQRYDRFAASDIVHAFISREPGQVRGFPRLASCLETIAELRDYDDQVMDAARAAANNGTLLYTDAPELMEHAAIFTGRISLERQVAKAVPPGYKIGGQSPIQPAAHYIEFRHERLRSLGRPWNMPLLAVLLSAEDSNFSQSRIDLNVIYQRAINSYQNWIENAWLKPLLNLVLREAGLAFAPGKTSRDANPFLLPPRPKKVEMRWGWDPIDQANEIDHTRNQIERIVFGLTSVADELARDGKTEDTILESLKRTNEKRIKHGLPPLPGPVMPTTGKGKVHDSENEQSKTPEGSANGSGKTPKPKRPPGRRPATQPVNA